jgi:TolB-like protein
MKKILFFSACLSLIIHNLAFILASERLNIAVAEFEARNVSQMDAVSISDFLRTELVKSEVFNVIDRNNMQRILVEQRFQQTGCTTQECAVKMGQVLNVQRIIIGTLLKFGAKWYVNADMIDVESAKIISSEKVEANAQEELVELMEVLAATLSGKKRTSLKSTKIESTKQEYKILKTKIEGVVALVNG